MRLTWSLLAVALSALSLAACGGSDSDSATAASGSSSGSDANERDAARVRLTECLRENGVDVPDPGQRGGPGQGGGRPDFDREELQEALEGPCKEFRDDAFGDISEEDRQEFQDAFQAFAQCMRDNGVDLPDPGQGGGPGAGGPPGRGGGIDMDDPDVQAAQEKCRDKLPQGGPGGGGPGGGPPSQQ